ncbi:MAG: IgA Peptidase M64 [Marinilabiliales bacterium]|nr:IgA Peptidase M64 [Marinilabiliales bacterium]
MKKFLLLILLFPWLGLSLLQAVNPFETAFSDGVLRYDYLLTGNNKTQKVIEMQIKKEAFWGGCKKLAVEAATLGTYRFNVTSAEKGTLLYSQGFSPLFQEWQTTAEASRMERAFYQVIRFPFPRQKVELSIECRDKQGHFQVIHQAVIDPDNYFILAENPLKPAVTTLRKSGDPSRKIDVAILAEGYRADEMDKFRRDASRLTDTLFHTEPFASEKDQFNIYAIETPSVDSGTGVPGRKIYQNTVFNSTFYTFDIERYLTTSDMKDIADMAACVPYDHLIVLVNSKIYGGGGFYNFICVCTADHPLTPKVFVHEFGHAFAGLGDEYYNSEVAYQDYYNLKVEPWEPNLTTLVNFKAKWQDLVQKGTPVPTPRTPEYENKVGAFEGGGYMTKGIYSPMQDCRMKSNRPDKFCPVCQQAIRNVIRACTE